MDRLARGSLINHTAPQKNNRTESNLDGSCQIYHSARASRSAMLSRMRRTRASRASRSAMPLWVGRTVSSGGSSGPFMTRFSLCCLSALHGSHMHLSGCVSSLVVSSASIWFDIAIETKGRIDLRVAMFKRLDRLARGSDIPQGGCDRGSSRSRS